ncbi:MAG: hypothetical protein Ct9H300mP1_24050 [Planctomycetaceae bacterium]|nr:MAG: hypothetical protein Ct9H300mP1_24050 [Planctomycetaceae bacterium]
MQAAYGLPAGDAAQQAAQRAQRGHPKRKEGGTAFLAGNAKKKGVKTTKSGLQYQVLKAGKGARPKATDTVEVHYRGMLIDGKVFESRSRERFRPKPTKRSSLPPTG